MTKSALILALFFACGTVFSQAVDVKEIWRKECAKCHANDGKGDTKMGKKVGAKDYTDPKVQAAMKDDEMFKVIKEGKKEGSKTLMKGFPELSDAEVKDLVTYVRGLKK
jgi:cytochrome c6